MEKKTYIIPAMKVRRIKTPSLLSSSSDNINVNPEGTTPTQRAKQGNGLDWGDTGWSDSEEESEGY